ncbi:hypothetical protein ANN_04973 [Periplaneta americana]|uniref:TIR domain-containing protein n=1 Tax=Periplaneta americana TaxID=6978 RepID=A0ABQ8T9U4_PERAM|nr:hypothetical protein ANN_04973 [Periplaneta americana]
METLRLEHWAFSGIRDLRTLRLSHNNFGTMGKPSLIFAGLTNLTVLDLSYNQITGWMSEDKYTREEPTLPSLETLDLSGNPLVYLYNHTFEWLRGSRLKHLVLRECDIKSIQTGILNPVQSTLQTLDIGNAYVPHSMLILLLNSLSNKSSLEGLGLSNIGFTMVPYNILRFTNSTLRYLSLHGNIFRTLGVDQLRKTNKLLQHATQTNNGSSEENVMTLLPDTHDFPYLPLLEELDLSKCSIYFIQRGTFATIPNLKALILSQNQLISFRALNTPTFSNLVYLDLSNNPLHMNTLNLTDLSSLEILDLSFTLKKRIYKNTFQVKSTKLKKLSLCYSKLIFIEDGAFEKFNVLELLDLKGNINLGQTLSDGTFRGLTSLEELHLDECTLRVMTRLPVRHRETMELEALRNLISLKRVNLARNDITTIGNSSLKNLTKLESLDVSENYIRSWTIPIFNDTNLRNLNIAGNHLNYITDAMLKDFSILTTLVISSNPFVCTCKCLDFLELVQNITHISENTTSTELLMPVSESKERDFVSYFTDEYIIMQTRSGFKALDDYQSERFIRNWEVNEAYMCLDNVNSNEMNYINFEDVVCNLHVQDQTLGDPIDEDSNEATGGKEAIIISAAAVVLLMSVVGGVIYSKWWYIRYFAILVKNATVLSLMSNDNDTNFNDRIFNYDTFISYCDYNRDWVLDNLLPNLETNSNLKVCLHERDFQVGISILENIIASMDQSRTILLVISQPFLRSQWCQFELHLAQHRLLETRREELILLFLEDIPKSMRPKTLQYLMKTKTYMLWPKQDDADAKKLFWKRLHRAVLRNTVEANKKHVSTA